MVQRSLKKHRGKIGLSAQVEMAMPGDSLSISLAPGAQGSTKAVCPTLSNQDAMKIDQILRIVEDFSLFFAILTCGSHPPARFVNMNSSDSSKIRNKLDKSQKKNRKNNNSRLKSTLNLLFPSNSDFCSQFVVVFLVFLMFFLVVFCGVFFEITTSLGIRFHIRYIYLHRQRKMIDKLIRRLTPVYGTLMQTI